MKRFFKALALVGLFLGSVATADACTNFIVTRGASTDGSEPITVVSRKKHHCTVSIKDGRYNIDSELAKAIMI